MDLVVALLAGQLYCPNACTKAEYMGVHVDSYAKLATLISGPRGVLHGSVKSVSEEGSSMCQQMGYPSRMEGELHHNPFFMGCESIDNVSVELSFMLGEFPFSLKQHVRQNGLDFKLEDISMRLKCADLDRSGVYDFCALSIYGPDYDVESFVSKPRP
ncbi:hypothetical protein H6504_04805 [Candidatus Woesearchaeota archaeon]|nr:hypothetical protein [Candidatus Woesearchaeota archaeon]